MNIIIDTTGTYSGIVNYYNANMFYCLNEYWFYGAHLLNQHGKSCWFKMYSQNIQAVFTKLFILPLEVLLKIDSKNNVYVFS